MVDRVGLELAWRREDLGRQTGRSGLAGRVLRRGAVKVAVGAVGAGLARGARGVLVDSAQVRRNLTPAWQVLHGVQVVSLTAAVPPREPLHFWVRNLVLEQVWQGKKLASMRSSQARVRNWVAVLVVYWEQTASVVEVQSWSFVLANRSL